MSVQSLITDQAVCMNHAIQEDFCRDYDPLHSLILVPGNISVSTEYTSLTYS
jgi:hypothetical protein